jgi:hypothetical protein
MVAASFLAIFDRGPLRLVPDLATRSHPSTEVASLPPNAEITVFSWKEPEELNHRTIDRVRRF